MSNRIFVGLDLTDRYAKEPRPIDVACLTPGGDVTFHQIDWAQPIQVGLRSLELTPDNAILILDGPQGLATAGQNQRDAERKLSAPGKTPDSKPQPHSRPFAGYIRSSVELYEELLGLGYRLLGDGNTHANASLMEAYPGAAWRRLWTGTGTLSSKSTTTGQLQRSEILRKLGCRFSTAQPLSHDQLDAALCAVLGRAFVNDTPSFPVVAIGRGVERQGDVLREGQILMPNVRDLDRSNKDRDRSREPQPVSESSGLQWVYLATPAGGSASATLELAEQEGIIVRSVYNRTGQRIANVSAVQAGDRVLIAYRERGRAMPLAVCTVSAPVKPWPDQDSCTSRVDDRSVEKRIQAAGYTNPDPNAGVFTVFYVSNVTDANGVSGFTVDGNNTIRRASEFGL